MNGSEIDAHCSNIVNSGDGTIICTDPASSVLFDGQIPTLTGLDSNMWASQLLTLDTIDGFATIALEFTDSSHCNMLENLDISLFHCPEWNITVQTIRLRESNSISTLGEKLELGNPTSQSCDSLTTVSIPEPNCALSVNTLEIMDASRYVYLAEVTFSYATSTTTDPNDLTGPPSGKKMTKSAYIHTSRQPINLA